MAQIDIEKFLVRFYDKKDRFVGNGSILKYPDGERTLATATHVIFCSMLHPKSRVFAYRDFQDVKYPLDPNSFRRRLGKDIAEVELPPGDGIEVAETFNGFAKQTVVGSIGKERFATEVGVLRIDGKLFLESDDPRRIPAQGFLIELFDHDPPSFPGPAFDKSSGSIILNERGQAFAIHTHVDFLRKSHLLSQFLVEENGRKAFVSPS